MLFKLGLYAGCNFTPKSGGDRCKTLPLLSLTPFLWGPSLLCFPLYPFSPSLPSPLKSRHPQLRLGGLGERWSRARPPNTFWRIVGLNLHLFEYIMHETVWERFQIVLLKVVVKCHHRHIQSCAYAYMNHSLSFTLTLGRQQKCLP